MNLRMPRIVSHVLDNESKSETLGFAVFVVASVKPGVTADQWLWCTVVSSILVGGKMVAKSLLEAMELKAGIKPKEDKADVAPAS